MRAGRLLLAVTLAGIVAGCAGATEPLTDPEVPLFSTPAPPGSLDGRPVPESCLEVASAEELSTILGTLVTGEPRPVVGVPQDNIGRTARLDCYYGVPAGKPTSAATVWIGLASYTDAQSARRRLTNTVADERAAGARVSDVPVGPDRGVLLRGTTWMLVAVRGATTVVATVRPNLVREDQAGAILGELADAVLKPREPAG
ncbi:MAG TPA: hypothetical protein VNP92_07605 [Actinophytocola sp.]|nr:hypothetical protein [Actinophytocola sp.]